MNKSAVYHIAGYNYAFPLDKETLMVRLRAQCGDLNSVKIIYGSRYPVDGSEPFMIKEMNLSASDLEYNYFETTIKLKDARFRYHFLLESGGEVYWFNEEGFSLSKPQGYFCGFFQYPCINESDIYNSPVWVRDALFYEIFPERFYNGDRENDPENVESWGKLPGHDSFFGGDLAGIIEKLDYLNELGINALYLTPIFKSSSNHKYNIDDYYQIDPRFGDKETGKRLVKEAHKRGIRVILDAVYNHAGFDFFAFNDLREKGQNSAYLDWFQIDSLPLKTTPPLNYRTFANDIPHMPKLNTSNEEVQQYLIDAALYWTKELDIDGWRLDVSDEVDHQFWKKFRKSLRKVKDDIYLVGEIWYDSNRWLQGDEFDGVMNYRLLRNMIDFFAEDKIGPRLFNSRLTRNWMKYQLEVNYNMLNLLDSHDTVRMAEYFSDNKERMKLAILFQFTYPGAPMIYYGDEVGLFGEEDPDCRRCMIWEKDKQDQELYNYYQQLIFLRKELSALRRGNYSVIIQDEARNIIGFKRIYDKQEVIVILNNSSVDNIVYLYSDQITSTYLKEHFSEEVYHFNDGIIEISLKPYSGAVLSNI